MTSKKFINKNTFEIVTQVPILQISEYERYDENFNLEQVHADIFKANDAVKSRYKYQCGIVDEQTKRELGIGDLFFESPDGQNGELYNELRNLGWINAGYACEYDWRVRKGIYKITYTEGDLYITKYE